MTAAWVLRPLSPLRCLHCCNSWVILDRKPTTIGTLLIMSTVLLYSNGLMIRGEGDSCGHHHDIAIIMVVFSYLPEPRIFSYSRRWTSHSVNTIRLSVLVVCYFAPNSSRHGAWRCGRSLACCWQRFLQLQCLGSEDGQREAHTKCESTAT